MRVAHDIGIKKEAGSVSRVWKREEGRQGKQRENKREKRRKEKGREGVSERR